MRVFLPRAAHTMAAVVPAWQVIKENLISLSFSVLIAG